MHRIAFLFQVSFTVNKARLLILTTWLVGFTYEGLYVLLTSQFKNGRCAIMEIFNPPSTQKYVAIGGLFFEFFLPVLLLFFAYARIIHFLRSAQKSKNPVLKYKLDGTKGPGKKVKTISDKISSGINDKTSAINENRDKTITKAKKNLVKTLICVSGAFILCWVGNETYLLLYVMDYSLTWSEWYYYASVVAVTATGSINPYIYCLQYDEARKNLYKIFCGKSNTQEVTSSDTQNTSISE